MEVATEQARIDSECEEIKMLFAAKASVDAPMSPQDKATADKKRVVSRAKGAGRRPAGSACSLAAATCVGSQGGGDATGRSEALPRADDLRSRASFSNGFRRSRGVARLHRAGFRAGAGPDVWDGVHRGDDGGGGDDQAAAVPQQPSSGVFEKRGEEVKLIIQLDREHWLQKVLILQCPLLDYLRSLPAVVSPTMTKFRLGDKRQVLIFMKEMGKEVLHVMGKAESRAHRVARSPTSGSLFLRFRGAGE